MPRGRDHSYNERLEYRAWRAEHVDPGAGRKIEPDAPTGTLELVPPNCAIGRQRRLYFTDPAGIRWRVYDVSYGPPEGPPRHEIAYPPPYPAAKGRVFISANGKRRYYSFGDRHAPPEARRPVVTPRVVSAQFRLAGHSKSTAGEMIDGRRDFAILPIPRTPLGEQHSPQFHTSTINRWAAYNAD